MVRATWRALAACVGIAAAMLVVPAVGWTLFALGIWALHGIGFVHALGIERANASTILGWILAIWAGLVAQIVILAGLYFAVPGCTIEELCWPVTIVLAAASLTLASRYRRAGTAQPFHDGWVLIALSAVATLLVLRPLLAHGELGFYYSDNGEFANYAALTDIVRYHDASTPTNGLAIVSREGVAGTIAAMICVQTGKSALWVIQPVAAAFSALAFASIGLLFRMIAASLPREARAVIWTFFACAILSASSQCFFTLSFVSQYLNLALVFGGIAFLAHARELATWRRLAVLAVLFAACIASYPEMFLPNVALVAAYEIGAATPPPLRKTAGVAARSLAGVAIAVAAGMLLVHRLGVTLLVERAALSGGGWNIYGAHQPLLPFIARLVGFTNTFAPPHTRSLVWPAIVAALVVASLVHAVARFRREPDPTIRGLYHVGLAFFVGAAGVFWLVSHRHLASNYVALKFVLGYGWLAFVLVALGVARAIELRRWMLVPIALVVGTILVGLATPALEYTKKLHRAEQTALYLEGDRCAASLRGRIYVSATRPGNDAIVGRFIAYQEDLLSVEGRWPDGGRQVWIPGEPVLLLGDGSLRDDPQILLPYHRRCDGSGFSVFDP